MVAIEPVQISSFFHFVFFLPDHVSYQKANRGHKTGRSTLFTRNHSSKKTRCLYSQAKIISTSVQKIFLLALRQAERSVNIFLLRHMFSRRKKSVFAVKNSVWSYYTYQQYHIAFLFFILVVNPKKVSRDLFGKTNLIRFPILQLRALQKASFVDKDN